MEGRNLDKSFGWLAFFIFVFGIFTTRMNARIVIYYIDYFTVNHIGIIKNVCFIA